ncbi:MAG: ATP-binding protein [Prevotellaceae bacterium]|jgi:predicted AAA+ superfamily ATPase|nr:ATP-binding protein [Prevotellaceae bacterium]
MIKRLIEKKIVKAIHQKKVAVVMGARQTGKTTLLRQLFKENTNVLWLSGDDPDVQSVLENVTSTRWRAIIGQNKTVVIDEAQYIPNIGIKLKLITDQLPDIQLIATGSSSFDLANKINEPLTGRKREIMLFPLSLAEMTNHHGLLEERRLLRHRLVFGCYPEVVFNFGEEREVLKELINSYLYKDILLWERIRKPDKIVKLLQAIAFQVGQLVSYNELGQLCGLDSKTVEQYVILLEQSYIIFRLGAFSRNLRNELKNSRKIYFYDNGIRNALISNFNQTELRNDTGALWENFMISERIKMNHYNDLWGNNWFWRTQQQQEIDYIEDHDGIISGYEFKWNPKSQIKRANIFLDAYPNSTLQVIHIDNYEDFLF